jgi:hypothetical protein
MGVLRAAQLDPGWTAADYRTVLLNLLTQSWGPYTLYNGNGIVNQYAEFSDFDGGKCYLDFANSTTINMRLASDVDVITTGSPNPYNQYRNVNTGATNCYNSGFSGSATVFMIAIASAQYRYFMALSGSSVAWGGYAILQRTPAFWGTNSRVYLSNVGFSGQLLAGENPWGVYNTATKAATTAGIQQSSFWHEGTRPRDANTVLGLRLITKNHPQVNAQSVIGYAPDDFVTLADNGINPMTKFQDQAGVQYIHFAAGYGIQLDAA